MRTKEGLASATGVLSGDAPPELIEIREGSSKYLVDVHHGHKTGFYLDQRENRSAVAQIARGRECLNCFCYTGAFTVPAFSGGAAAVTSMDSSGPALEIAKKNLDLNGLPHGEIVEGDVFGVLRQYRDSDRKFDFIILDPPKFVHSKGQIEKGARAYKDINWLAMRLLRPGGLLMTFSCSGLVSEDLFQKILFGAALDSGREVRIIRRLGQATDHPVALTFPEGNYLKGFLLQAD